MAWHYHHSKCWTENSHQMQGQLISTSISLEGSGIWREVYWIVKMEYLHERWCFVESTCRMHMKWWRCIYDVDWLHFKQNVAMPLLSGDSKSIVNFLKFLSFSFPPILNSKLEINYFIFLPETYKATETWGKRERHNSLGCTGWNWTSSRSVRDDAVKQG